MNEKHYNADTQKVYIHGYNISIRRFWPHIYILGIQMNFDSTFLVSITGVES